MLTTGILETSVRAVGGGIWARAARLFDRSGGGCRGAENPPPEGELREHIRSFRGDGIHHRPDRLLGVAASRWHRADGARDHFSALTSPAGGSRRVAPDGGWFAAQTALD